MVARPGGAASSLPDPDSNWDSFVQAVRAAQTGLPEVFCPIRKQPRPWLDTDALAAYAPDPVRAILEQNEPLLWSAYLFYSYNSAYFRDGAGGVITPAKTSKLRPMPVFKTSARYEKKLLNQDDLWAMLNDFGLVPAIVNTIRFNAVVGEMGGRRNATDKVRVNGFIGSHT